MPNQIRCILAGTALTILLQGPSAGQEQARLQRPGPGTKNSSQQGTRTSGLPQRVHQAEGGQPHSATGFGTAVAGGRHLFTPKYLAIRERLLKDFEHHGQIAESADGPSRSFSDQTLYMGFALLAFAGEARILHQSGHDARPSEHVLHRLLQAFESLDKDAERERYHTSVPGFFLRDYMKEWPGFQVHSGFLDSAITVGEADMSLDQVVSLMMGWWAASHWSTDAGNRNLAKAQAERVLNFLCNERFMIDRPGTRDSVPRGYDARAAAGFLCHIGEQIAGQDYYNQAKIRQMHDNRCHTCGGTGLVNIPNPDLHCPACNGTGHCRIVIGGGRCEVCRGTGDVKLVVEAECPGCRGSGEIRAVVTNPFTGDDVTVGKTRCGLCNGSGKIGGKTELGRCKVCHGKGRLPQYTRDLGRCKLCGGSGRLRGSLPKVKCPVCGGSKERNLYVWLTHPIILSLEPAAFAVLAAPRLEMHQGKVSIHGDNKPIAQAYVRHMNLVLLAFESEVADAALLAEARDSNHPWAPALRAAIESTVCPACHGHGTAFVMAQEASMRGPVSSEAVQILRRGLPHIPFAVGCGRSGPSQTCPRTR
jgi:DnaJ-class molecular chaperone